ncbi:ribonuclease Z [Oceanobacillus oncorhynchi subsp. incaldanensis]|uniref:ribonuclease Z n=1 Tax=Oceanobacillus oncorhynchi TaxID=545501 RepID=UPI001B03B496|nr:ribonuclease Z [Oceanobacillus oncorhynchi]GIO17136.1 ribonuclease Z [Oceanobacillus oncorhynchi subsp. incaldanensis]
MEITFLGTGAGLPSKERNVTAVALSMLQELNEVWLFDCGEATQHQLLHTKIKPGKINKIFISHMHGDHIYGLPGFLSSRSFQAGADRPLTIYGPVGTKEFIQSALKLSYTHLTYPLTVIEIKEGLLFETEAIEVYAKKLVHGVPSFGFRIVEKDKPGELLVDKLKEKGIRPGPVYGEIKEKPSVTLEDGTIIYRSDFIGSPKKGRVISILGDTTYQAAHKEFVKNSDLLIHEATFAADKETLAEDYFHSTNIQAAKIALDAGCKQLILTHISSRYQFSDMDAFLEETKEVFLNTSIAGDFSVFQL